MLNLLIAVMGDSFDNVKADEVLHAMFEQAEKILEYERLLITLRLWDPTNRDRFPRYMVIAEEVVTQGEESGDGTTGRMRQHLDMSTDTVSKRVDRLEEEMKRQHEETRQQHEETKQQHEETKRLLDALMSRLGEQ